MIVLRNAATSLVLLANALGAQGPTPIADLSPGFASSSFRHLIDAEGTLFFYAFTGSSHALFRFDTATSSLVELVRLGNTLPGFEREPVAIGDRVYFAYDDGRNGFELWSSDGSRPGTAIVADLNPGPGSSSPTSLTVMGGKLYFTTIAPPAFGHHEDALWVYDPATGQAQTLTQFATGTYISLPYPMTVVGETLFFWGTTSQAGKELWKSDGTAAGTTMVADIWRGSGSSRLTWVGTAVDDIDVANNGVFYFTAYEPNVGHEFYRSDGTTIGTYLVKDVVPGPTGAEPRQLTVVGKTLFFVSGSQLWKSDGTTTGTSLVQDFDPSGTTGFAPRHLTASAGLLFFEAGDATHGDELWRSNGTKAGTQLVADLRDGSSSSDPGELFAAGTGKLFFAASSDSGRGMWTSDGTAGGTTEIMADANPADFTLARGQVYLTAWHSEIGRELFVHDPGALRRRIGFGCGDASPRLRAPQDPVLGTTVTLSVKNAGASRGGVLMIGSAVPEPQLTIPSGCFLFVSATDSIPFLTNSAGRWSYGLPIPNDPALRGVTIAVQAGLYEVSFSRPTLSAWSNGLHLVPGS